MAVVRYLVKSIDEVLPFYASLGFEIIERWGPPFAVLARADLTLWLSGPGSSASRLLADGSLPGSGGWNRIVIEVSDLAKTMAEIKPTAARFRSEPISGPGGIQVVVEDPSGNPVELFQAGK